MHDYTSASKDLREAIDFANKNLGKNIQKPRFTQVVRIRTKAGKDAGQILEENKQGRHKSKCDLEDSYPETWLQISYRAE